MGGAIVLTASGKTKYYVVEPTHRFWRAAHRGSCFLKDASKKLKKGAYRVHWNTSPDAVSDGVRKIESLM
jgi:hypothetical protein